MWARRGPRTCLIKPKYVKLQRGEPEREKDTGKYDHYKGWEVKERTQEYEKVCGEINNVAFFHDTFYQVCKHRHSLNNKKILNISLLLCSKRKPKVCSVFLVYCISIPLCCCVLSTTELWTTLFYFCTALHFFSCYFSLLNKTFLCMVLQCV